ncbi:unnamed protein product [Trifolium pratense]|uniref:Uncharacterized protein n=1 Tax=Trifolium pratense TaxID=57577 RepID=A0ACB0L356_TRIPR|nr:unnamed protein product [Trifolium pratense]
MAESSKGKKPEAIEEQEMQDRISNLPDGLRSHVLSFLPTKTTVQTSILSKKWHHIWKHQSVLYFTEFTEDYHLYEDKQSDEQFKSFVVMVNSVLNLLHNPRAIRKMTLLLLCFYTLFEDKFRQYSVNNWIQSVIGPYLEELHLTLVKDRQGPDFKLPQTLFTSPNLVSLSLVGGISLQKLSSTPVSFPLLKNMLISIGSAEVLSVNALLSGCPIIETLDLSFCSMSLDKVCIPPSLKRLIADTKNDRGAYLEINAPDLEYLNITKITFGEVFSMYNVVEAHLDVFPHSLSSVTSLHNLLGALSGTKYLVLSPSTSKWLLGEPRDLLFQEFRYLVRLVLNLPRFNYNSLISLLQKCPMLQVLIIHNVEDKEQSPVLRWAPQRSVPSCLVSHLKFIKFQGFLGLQDELFIKYALRNGLVLEAMIVFDISVDQKQKCKIMKKLSNVRRACGMCQLIFA